MKGHEPLTRQAMRAFNEQDVEGFVATLHSDYLIEFIGGFDGVIGEGFEGEEGARRFYEDWFAAFETIVPVELLGAAIYSFRDDRISRAAFYYDRDEALEAAGLGE